MKTQKIDGICILTLFAMVFALDISMPLGIVTGELYAVVIFVACFVTQEKKVLSALVLVAAALVLGVFIYELPNAENKVYSILNRIITIKELMLIGVFALRVKPQCGVHSIKLYSSVFMMLVGVYGVYISGIHGEPFGVVFCAAMFLVTLVHLVVKLHKCIRF